MTMPVVSERTSPAPDEPGSDPPPQKIAPSRQVNPADPYTEAVRKVLPVEVTGAFIAVNSLIPQRESLNYWVIGVVVVLAVICGFYLRLREDVSNLWQVVGMSAVAFPVWAAAVASSRCSFLSDNTFVMPVLLIVVSLVVPLMSSWKPGAGQ